MLSFFPLNWYPLDWIPIAPPPPAPPATVVGGKSILQQKLEQYVKQQSSVSDAAKHLGRLGGLKGGPARASSLSPLQRSTIAAKGAQARWR